MDTLGLIAAFILVASAVFLAWPTSRPSPIIYTPNKNREFGADPYYYRIDAYDPTCGMITTFLFTGEQLSVAAERANRNPEDVCSDCS